MNAELKEAFSRIKPVCDIVMVCPNVENVRAFMSRLSEMKKEAVQELQQYLLFPFITHIKSTELEKNYELLWRLVDSIQSVLEKVTVNNFDMCMKLDAALLSLVFDSSNVGMIANVPEELKLSVMRCLTVLMLNLERSHRIQFLKTQVPILAQAVFVAVHMAKLEKLRTLRLAGLNCVMAHTAIHSKFTKDNYKYLDSNLEMLVVDTLASILPGLLAALQDVAMSSENPGHAVIVTALEAIHRAMCLTMNDKFLCPTEDVTIEDFERMFKEKMKTNHKDVSNKEDNPKNITKRSPEWYTMAGDKLTLVTKSIAALRTHEHHKVRKELAIVCSRILLECNITMRPSVPLALDILISLRKDDYPTVSQHCAQALDAYFSNTAPSSIHIAMDALCDNFYATLTKLPRILNNIDTSRKLSCLNLLHGYIEVLTASGGSDLREETLAQNSASCSHALAQALSNASVSLALAQSLLQAAAHHSLHLFTQHAQTDVTAPPPLDSPWYKLRHLDTPDCEQRLKEICQLLGNTDCADLLLDQLLDMFESQTDCEIVYIMNCVGSAPKSSLSLVRRILDKYIEEDIWYSPLELSSGELPVSSQETLDVTVYNPRAWTKDSVPDLYEGATETRYTDISYQTPRPQIYREPNKCATVGEAQKNMVRCCLLAEGVGLMARRLMSDYQPYLYKTLCLILERVGSKYEMLHLAGLKAINDIAFAGSHPSVADLIRCNADYFTDQVTKRLKKAWNSESALQILSVVMEYSDHSILNCLYGIVQDVLVQSCDKYHDRNLCSYLQVFLTFIARIHKWFPIEKHDNFEKSSEMDSVPPVIDIAKELFDYIENKETAERLLNEEEFEEDSGKTAEEMYREDQKLKEDNILDYDDRVTNEKPPLPQHITVTITILKRCLHFIPSKQREESTLALQVLNLGLPILSQYEDELLPLVHLTWAPLVTKFESKEAIVLRRSFELLVTMAAVSKDFIRQRTVKDVLPHIQSFLKGSSANSHLKDKGSAYRSSHAYNLQVTVLTYLPTLAVDLGLEDQKLEDTMLCVDCYLSKKQPRPLQDLAVKFYQIMLRYDYGATWHHLRQLCANDHVLTPPPVDNIELKPVVGTPYTSVDTDLENNIKLIFE